LKKLSQNKTDSTYIYNWLLPIVKNRQNPIILEHTELESYVGEYGKGDLKFKDNKLYYVWNDKINFLLTPITDDTFILDGILDFRIQVIIKNSVVTGIKRIYEDGYVHFYKKKGC
jgi:hypothetical protein